MKKTRTKSLKMTNSNKVNLALAVANLALTTALAGKVITNKKKRKKIGGRK